MFCRSNVRAGQTINNSGRKMKVIATHTRKSGQQDLLVQRGKNDYVIGQSWDCFGQRNQLHGSWGQGIYLMNHSRSRAIRKFRRNSRYRR